MTLIWGSTFVLIKEALDDSSPLVLNAARMAVAAVLLAEFYRKQIAVLHQTGAHQQACLLGFFLFSAMHFRRAG